MNKNIIASPIKETHYEDFEEAWEIMSAIKIEPQSKTKEEQIRELALHDPVVYVVLASAHINGLNWMETLEALVLTLQSQFSAARRSMLDHVSRCVMPTAGPLPPKDILPVGADTDY